MSLLKRNAAVLPYKSFLSDFFNAEKFFDSDFFKESGLTSTDIPAANVKEKDKEFEIELAAPGFSKQDFKVSLENDILTVSAEKQEEKKDQKENYTRREFSYNSIKRSFELPEIVDKEGIKAEYKDGILQLLVPKKNILIKGNSKEISIS